MRIVSIEQARETFCELADAVATTSEPVIVEKQGQPVTVLISPEDYEMLREQRWDGMWLAIAQIRERNVDKDPTEEYGFITEVVEEVRQEIYDEAQGEAKSRR